MEMIYQSAVLSNPSSEIGSDFDTVGLGGSEADLGDGTTLLLRTYGRSDSIGTASGDLDFVTITFDWTGDATEIIFNPVGSGTGQGSFQMLVGELSPLGVEACSLAPAVATETPEPTVTPTATPTETPTVEPTNTVEVEPTAEVIAAATSTPLPTATFTPTPTPTSTPQPTDTPTVVPTETAVPTTVTLPVTEGESLTIYQSEDPIFDAFPEIGHDETCGLIEGVNETLIRWNLAEIPADATLESVRFTITFSDSFIGLPFIKITTLSQAWEAGETLESIQGAKRIILFDPQENLDSDIIEVNSGSPPTFTMVFSAETVNDFATWRDDFINNGVVLSAALGNSSYSFDCYGYGERENGDPSINFPELELIYNVP